MNDELTIPRIGEKYWHAAWGWLTVEVVRLWPVPYVEATTESGTRVPSVLSQLWSEEWV